MHRHRWRSGIFGVRHAAVSGAIRKEEGMSERVKFRFLIVLAVTLAILLVGVAVKLVAEGGSEPMLNRERAATFKSDGVIVSTIEYEGHRFFVFRYPTAAGVGLAVVEDR
jgi:hypothetical protein